MAKIMMEHVKKYDDLFLVTPPIQMKETQPPFTITGPYFDVVRKYVDMRPSHAIYNNFFLNYRFGKITNQTIGKNKLHKMPERIAKYLNLSDPERYKGMTQIAKHKIKIQLAFVCIGISFRRTSLSLSKPTKRRSAAQELKKRKKRSAPALNDSTPSSTAASDTSISKDSVNSCDNNLSDVHQSDDTIKCAESEPESLAFDDPDFDFDNSDDCFDDLTDPFGDIDSEMEK